MTTAQTQSFDTAPGMPLAPVAPATHAFDPPFIPTDVVVVSEDAPDEWRVSERTTDRVSGPFPDDRSALRIAFQRTRRSPRWEIHVLDRYGTLLTTYTSL